MENKKNLEGGRVLLTNRKFPQKESKKHIPCKFCKKKRAIFLRNIESPWMKRKFPLYFCKSCKSRFFKNINNKKFLESVYALIANTEKGYDLKFNISSSWVKQRRIIQKILGKNPDSILDIGCKTGDFLMHFDNSFREGVELSKKHAKIAKKRGLYIYNNFLEDINFKKKYEVVTAYAVLEHLDRHEKFMAQLKKIVRKKGLLVIMIPTSECLKEKILTFFNKRWIMYSPPEHLNFYSKKYLDNYLSSQGFKLVYRYWSSGENFNHFSNVPFIGNLFKKIINFMDNSFFNKIPIFDHMYSFYRKIN